MKTKWVDPQAGTLAVLEGTEHDTDPCPEIPTTFLEPARVAEWARQLKAISVPPTRTEPTAEPPAEGSAEEEPPRWRVELSQRSVVATRESVEQFAPMLAQAAWQRGFAGAKRQAFVADGSAGNWGVWRRYFGE